MASPSAPLRSVPDGPRGTRALRQELVPRAGLVRRLVESSGVPVVVLVAPAGYGKTTLLTEWSLKDARPFIWVQRGDAGHGSLASAICQALVDSPAFDSRFANALERMRPGEPPETPRSVVLVVDDADAWQGGLDDIARVAGELPRGSQIALASRGEPSLPLGRLRARRAVVEMRVRDLAMTPFETATLLDLAGVHPEPQTVEALVHGTEGWPAGLRLAALSLLEQAGDRGACEHFDGADYIVCDYVRDEFLEGLPPDTLSFLTRSSVLPQLTGPLCDAVLERRGSVRLLRQLAHGNVPMTRLDRSEERFRYNRLFREALRADLRQLEPELEAELHRRASVWHQRSGDVGSALDHAIAAKDVDRASGLLWRHAPTYLGRGRNTAVAGWLSGFGDDQVTACAPLALIASHNELASGRRDDARRFARAAKQTVDSHDAELEGSTFLIAAAIADYGAARMRADAARAARLLPQRSPWLAMCSLLQGVGERARRRPRRAREHLEEGVRRAVLDAPDVQALCLAELALLAIADGDWERAAGHTLRARAQLDRYGLADHAMSALTLAVSALVRAHRGCVGDAKADLRRAAVALDPLVDFIPWYTVETHITLAHAALRLSEVSPARVFAERATAGARDDGWLRLSAAEVRARIDAVSGSGAAASSSLTTAELRILRFLPTHLSFREIGARLYVSGNTVKTQAHAVYRKLGVSSRSEAVARARTLALLDT